MENKIPLRKGDPASRLDALAFLLSCYDVWSATPLDDCVPCDTPPRLLEPLR
jgi:hypothetical protein